MASSDDNVNSGANKTSDTEKLAQLSSSVASSIASVDTKPQITIPHKPTEEIKDIPLRYTKGKRDGVKLGTDDNPQILLQKRFWNNDFAFQSVYPGQSAVTFYLDSDGDGISARGELNALLRKGVVDHVPLEMRLLIKAMSDPANTSELISDKPRHTEHTKLEILPSLPRFENTGGSVANAHARKLLDDFIYFKLKVKDHSAGERYVSIDPNRDGRVTFQEGYDVLRDPVISSQLTTEAKSSLIMKLSPALINKDSNNIFSEATRTNYPKHNAKLLNDEISYIDIISKRDKVLIGNQPKWTFIVWDEELRSKLSVLKEQKATGFKNEDLQAVSDYLSGHLNRLAIPEPLQKKIASLTDAEGYIDTLALDIHIQQNYTDKKDPKTKQPLMSKDQANDITCYVQLSNQVRSMITYWQAEPGFKDARLNPAKANEVQNFQRDYLFKNELSPPPNDPEIVSKFEVPGWNLQQYKVKIVDDKPTITSGTESVEHIMAVKKFKEATQIPIPGKDAKGKPIQVIVNLDNDGNGEFTNIEASRALNHLGVYLSPEQRTELRNLIQTSPEAEVISSIASYEKFMKQPLVAAGSEEATKEYIKMKDVDADGKVSVGEALKGLQNKPEIATTAKVK